MVARHRPSLCLIAAVARNGTVGHGNQIPWRLPEDGRHFRAQTLGCPVIMGRRTWDSLPARFRPLPGRLNLVVTRQSGWGAEGATATASLAAALDLACAWADSNAAPRVFVIGGAELYAEALPDADELLLTEIDADFAGDTRFPDWDRRGFVETSRARHHAAAPNDFDFDFVTYRRPR
jgi:dihydrofolate reductase